MEYFVKLLALVLAGCIVGLFLRGSPFRTLAVLAALVPAVLLMMQIVKPVVSLLNRLTEASQMEAAVFQPVIRASVIGMLTQTARGFCADAGEQALQKLLELGGVLTMLYVSLPLYEAVLSILQKLMEG